MTGTSSVFRKKFPGLDEEIFQYVEGVLENLGDFSDGQELHDAIGGLLMESVGADKDTEIRKLCEDLMSCSTNGVTSDSASSVGSKMLLTSPIQLAQMAEDQERQEEVKSVWIQQRDDSMKVDQKKLEKAEAKLREKREKRGNEQSYQPPAIVNTMATATQEISRKDRALDAKGGNNTKDIRIENFDVAFGDRVLIQNSTITLAFGRRYALIGRNGLGKTTLLRMIAAGVLRIPSHISVLHVEQEVTADDTSALESVLQCDTVRHALLQEEKALQQRIAGGDSDQALSERLAAVYAELQAIEADKAPAKASVILCGLGFTREMQQQATKKFSGGWRMRIALARALFTQPDLLLLDEPTNMLDLKAIIWLEGYLLTWPTTLLLVSHDRHFLDSVPTDVLHLHSRAIQSYRGNYENFLNTRTERQKNQQREYDSQMQFRAHVQEFIDKFRYNAKRASLVQSKIKMLEKLPELQPVEKESVVVFSFPDVDKLSPPILQLDEVSFRQLRIGYFSQHHVDQLDLRLSAVSLLQERFPGKPVEEYRRQLGRFGVSGDLALQQLASLSGGQKSRVAFAAMAAASPSFLILDEPTNHLDIETIEALGEAIKLYKGGVVLVSHDERLIRQVCTELWLCGNGTVRSIEGGFDSYRHLVQAEIAAVA
ncbi:hypothetical protein HAZT_HAZT011253 [Hyalella azteca]|uniref:ABC transporter domain-containing protein n=1 Tax=Hyalella azteca TaxID=294128 RepID=A0A6A0H0H1_HYAAZ|nr:hypothetical protein HAZT_HAZT011253 [Hyalella azteca]